MTKPRRQTLSALLFLLTLALSAPAAPAGAGPLDDAGLVEVTTLAPSIVLDIRYATADNFTGQPVYPAAKCFLRRDVAQRLVAAQAALQAQGLGLKVYDCYRPFSIQKRFWSLVPNDNYVAKPVEKDGKPFQGSKHNRGAAVDLTLIDAAGRELVMPTGYDDFSEKAGRNYPGNSPEAQANMKKLEAAMTAQGFAPLSSEWWHFDGPGWEGYELLDAPID
jgi:beta-N-acetylhexosaminidase/D-alanyl-D-alanine dipeptidase